MIWKMEKGKGKSLGLTVLVAEDEFLRFVKNVFERSGFDVLGYDNAQSAFETIKGGVSYDLLVTDLRFEQHRRLITYDGTDIINISRTLNPKIPIVVSSAYDHAPDGVSLFLEKPLFWDEEMGRIKRLVSSR